MICANRALKCFKLGLKVGTRFAQEDNLLTIPCRNEKEILIDELDYDLFNTYKWSIYTRKNNVWYARTRIDGEAVLLHRLIMQVSKGEEIDHINHNGLDNRRSNLRICTPAQNRANMQKHKGVSKYKGVGKSRNRYRAYIMQDYSQTHLGMFDTEEEAAFAYNQAALELFGEFAHLNKIGG